MIQAQPVFHLLVTRIILLADVLILYVHLELSLSSWKSYIVTLLSIETNEVVEQFPMFKRLHKRSTATEGNEKVVKCTDTMSKSAL